MIDLVCSIRVFCLSLLFYIPLFGGSAINEAFAYSYNDKYLLTENTNDFTPCGLRPTRLATVSISLSSTNIIMKQSPEEGTVYLNFQLDDNAYVSFFLYSRSEHLIHIWKEKLLTSGSHDVKLNLPELEEGTYLLRSKIDQDVYQHAVFIK